jgi:hypothetical protein
MNAILQQLFHFPEFRDLVFRTDFEQKDQQELKLLFCRLALSNRLDVDTRRFCELWQGWGGHPIQVCEQLDAAEFFAFFLDQLPASCQDLLKGEFVHTIYGIDCDYRSTHYEPFAFLSLDIRSVSTLQATFPSFLQAELLNQIQTDLRGKIDARRTTRIRKLPKVLVLHLKRFEYNLRMHARQKICSLLEFPAELDVTSLLENPRPSKYRLWGIVLHSGTADGGHYQSLIKTGPKWFRFDDSCVTKFPIDKLKSEAFGGHAVTGPCALLLFYEQSGNKYHSDFKIPERVTEIIEKENQEFALIQSLLSKATLRFISACNVPDLFFSYVFNIFIHSALSSESHIVSLRLIALIEAQKCQKEFFEFLGQNVKSLIEMYQNCSNPGILSCVHDVIGHFLAEAVDSECVLNFVDHIVESFKSLAGLWRQYEYIAHIPALYCRTNATMISLDFQQKWRDSATNLIQSFFAANKRFAADCNLAPVLDMLAYLENRDDPSSICSLFSEITANRFNISAFFIFIIKSHQPVPVGDLMTFFLTQRPEEFDSEAFMKVALTVLTETDYHLVFRDFPDLPSRFVLDSLIKAVRDGSEIVRRSVLANLNEFVIPYFADVDFLVRTTAQNLIYALFPHIAQLDSFDPDKPAPPAPELVPVLETFMTTIPKYLVWNESDYASYCADYTSFLTIPIRVMRWLISRSQSFA